MPGETGNHLAELVRCALGGTKEGPCPFLHGSYDRPHFLGVKLRGLGLAPCKMRISKKNPPVLKSETPSLVRRFCCVTTLNCNCQRQVILWSEIHPFGRFSQPFSTLWRILSVAKRIERNAFSNTNIIALN